MIKEQGNLTSLKVPPLLAKGYDPNKVKSWVPELQAVPGAARDLGRGLEQDLQLSAVSSHRYARWRHVRVARRPRVCARSSPVGRPAVDGISFHVPTGEIVVLLGPSGCGKTTTLRCVAGLEHATAGRISIGGRLVSAPADGVQVPPRQRNIGMVFQSYAVWPHMTVWQNVAYPLRHRGEFARRDRPQGRRHRSNSSACRNSPSGRWSRSPAGRCSGSRWRAASSISRSFCCSTSR